MAKKAQSLDPKTIKLSHNGKEYLFNNKEYWALKKYEMHLLGQDISIKDDQEKQGD